MKLPTDNLYKFVAVVGLMTFISSGYFKFLMSEKTIRTIDDLQRTNLEISRQQKEFSDHIFKSLKTLQESSGKSSQDFNQNLTQIGMETQRKAADQIAYMELNKTKFELIMWLDRLVSMVLFLGILAGPLMMYWGFTRWYKRLQVFLDKSYATYLFKAEAPAGEVET
jgi:hypothetical protein